MSGLVRALIGVAMTAGAIELTSTPVVASSLASALVIPITAALLAEYALSPGLPSLPAMLAMFTIRPHPRSTIPGTNARQVLKVPVTLTAKVVDHSRVVDLDEWLVGPHDAGAVDEDVDGSDAADDLGDRSGIGHVGRDVGPARHVEGQDPDAVGGEALSGGEADPTHPARDECRACHGVEPGAARSPLTGWASVPMPSTVSSTWSPGRRNSGGLRVKPTPPGVPVAITAPGNSVVLRLR